MIGKQQKEVCLKALESTEYVIHRNIKYRYMKFVIKCIKVKSLGF